MKSRYYQIDAETSVKTNITNGKRDNLIVIPVGGGKSVVIAHLALWALNLSQGKKALIVAHRKELSTQNAQKIQTINPEIAIGFEKSKDICPPEAQIMMASIQTIGKEGIPRVRAWAQPKDIGIILIDEAHHIPGGKTYQVLLEEIRQENPEVIVVGFTATPKRGDGEKIEDYISHLAYQVSMAELVENKFLARIIGFKIKTETSMASFVGEKRKDFDDAKLSKLINNQKRNQLALDTYKYKHLGESALVFCVSKAHARDMASLFMEAGIKAASITEDTPEKERETLIQDFKDQKLPVLSSVAVLSEGFDAPKIKALLMLRPTKSPVLFEQLLGRGLRLIAYPNPNDPDGEWLIDWETKSTCHIYDFVDQKATQAGACNLATALDLNPEFELNGENVFELKSRMDAMAEGDPLMAAAMAQAHTPEEIEALLQNHNLLAELEAIHYAPNQKADWMELSPTESWIQLPQGETCRVFQNALGSYELHCPPIDLTSRQKKQKEYLERNPDKTLAPLPESNSPDKKYLILGEEGHTPLQSENLSDALKEATNILFKTLPGDIHLLKSNANWKIKAQDESATDGQIRMLSNVLKLPLTIEEIDNLTKAQASDLITKASLQETLMIQQNRITFGKYKGAPLHLIHLYDPNYFNWLLTKEDVLQKHGLTEIAPAILQEYPLPWLKSFRPRLYQKEIAGTEPQYEKDWVKNPEDVRQTIKFALDHDTIPPWPLILKKAEEHKSTQKSY